MTSRDSIPQQLVLREFADSRLIGHSHRCYQTQTEIPLSVYDSPEFVRQNVLGQGHERIKWNVQETRQAKKSSGVEPVPGAVSVTATSFDSQRVYTDEKFSAVEVFRNGHMKVVCGYFEPGQFIPVHAPSSDVVIHIQTGRGIVRDGNEEHHVEPGDIVVVDADRDRGVKADGDNRLEALLITSPPPTDAEHDPVRRGIKQGEFVPQ